MAGWHGRCFGLALGSRAPPRVPSAAVQEERQRGKDRNENEVESTSSANEDMPVEKILEAELAVEPKTETYVEANMGLNPSSVSAARGARWPSPPSAWCSPLPTQPSHYLPGPRCCPLSPHHCPLTLAGHPALTAHSAITVRPVVTSVHAAEALGASAACAMSSCPGW